MATTEEQRETERSLIRSSLIGVFDESELQRSDYSTRDFELRVTTLLCRATVNLAETIESKTEFPPGPP